MEQWQREIKDEIARKLRVTAQEHGQKSIENAVVIGDFNPDDWQSDVFAGRAIMHAPTVSVYTLANVRYCVARTFEDA